MKRYLLSPGPTAVSPDATLAMAAPLIHHRGPEYRVIFGEVRERLKWLFQTQNEVLTLTCSGTGAFEAAFANFTKRGDTILSVGGGKFGSRWGKMGIAFGLDVETLDVPWGESADPAAIETLLSKGDISMLTMCASETSTGAYNPVKEVAELCQKYDTLCAIDGITGVGVHDLPMDKWGIDILVSGSQKAFSLPPGLGFVAASDKAWKRVQESDHPKFYFDLEREKEAHTRNQNAFTPAISLVIGLHKVLAMMTSEGLPNIFARHRRLAEATRAGVVAAGCELIAKNPSNAVTAARVPDGIDAPELVSAIRETHGVTIAGGQNELKPFAFRIGHLGYADDADVLTALSALEKALSDLGATIEPGAALKAAQTKLLSTS